jgi:hypothetical protein
MSSLGSYNSDKSGKAEHKIDEWRLGKAQIAQIKLDPTRFMGDLRKFRNPELIRHLNSDKNKKVLAKNGLDNVINTIEKISVNIVPGSDIETRIDNIRY